MMDKLKILFILLLASALTFCGCSLASPTNPSPVKSTEEYSPVSPITAEHIKTTAAPMVTCDPNITLPPPTPPNHSVPRARENWNIESRLAADIEYLEDDGVNGRGFCIRYEIKDLDNLGFYYEVLGGGLEYYNGTEWEVIVPYQHRDRKAIVLPQEQLGYALCQEAIMIRRWDERLPDGKYRYVKLIWDGSTPKKEEYVKIEFEIKKPT